MALLLLEACCFHYHHCALCYLELSKSPPGLGQGLMSESPRGKKCFNESSKGWPRASNNIKTLGRGGPVEIVYYTVMKTEMKARKWLSQTLARECLDSWPRASLPSLCFFRLSSSLPSMYQHACFTILHPPQPLVFRSLPVYDMFYEQIQEMGQIVSSKKMLRS